MKISRVALAVALAFGAGSALAQVTAETSVQLYGHIDVSVDNMTKGISGRAVPTGNPNVVDANGNLAPATGRLGWQPDVSSNLSYFGLRGGRDLGGGMRAVFQIETQVEMAATPGPTSDAQVKSGLGSRNSFLGLTGSWGAVKLGKTDAPYKLSTARMDPFSASVGDYNSIMGNTGGDNRAEFDTRISHAVWYESPMMGGFSFSALFSPGQNRSSDNSIRPSGEPVCAGGNNEPCNDGSFDNVYSLAGVYAAGPLYAILAYEMHKNVNRTGDEGPNQAPNAVASPPAGAVGIANERAMKAGVQYTVANTTVNVILERMTRNAPNANFNERQRNGYWLALAQKFSAADDLNLGWGHAGKSPGTPGANTADGTFVAGPVDNASNMYTAGYKHWFDKQTSWYAVYARQVNHTGAHYDLGASGHGITTDCKDANGNCFAGATLQAISFGMIYNF